MPIYRTPHRGLAYSEAIAIAYASAPDDEVILDTIELLNPNFVDAGGPFSARVVNDHTILTAKLEDTAPLNPGEFVDFSPCYFQLTRPSETEDGASGDMQLQIDNVSRRLVQYLDIAIKARDLTTIIFRPYLQSDLTGPHIDPVFILTVEDVEVNMSTVLITAGFSNFSNKRYPAREYTTKYHPNLVAR